MQRPLQSFLVSLSLSIIYSSVSAVYAQNTDLTRSFPDTSAKIGLFTDQLPSQVTDWVLCLDSEATGLS